VLAGYAAATALLEVARVDNDRPGVIAQLPWRFSDIARRHAVVATGVLAVLGAIAAAIVGWRVGAPPVNCALVAAAAAPVLVGAALLNVYRRATPTEWASADPYGLGSSLLFLWLLVGPVVALIALGPVTAHVFSAARQGQTTGGAVFGFVFTCIAGTTFELLLVTRRAKSRASAG